MTFNKHSASLADAHAFLAPSSPSWIRYNQDKLRNRWNNAQNAAKGTRLHDLAAKLIREGVKLSDSPNTLNMYVNDAISYKMTPELILFYSIHCFGTADAIGFRNNTLRIFDLKTGTIEATVEQLLVYAALFCLEYKYDPFSIEYDIRVYQNNEMKVYEVDVDDIVGIIDVIKTHSKYLDELQEEDGPI